MVPLYAEVQSTDGGETWQLTGNVGSDEHTMQGDVMERSVARFRSDGATVLPVYGYVRYLPQGNNNPTVVRAEFRPSRGEG